MTERIKAKIQRNTRRYHRWEGVTTSSAFLLVLVTLVVTVLLLMLAEQQAELD